LEFICTFQLDETKAAAAPFSESLQMAKGRQMNAMFTRHSQDRLAFLRTDQFTIDR
jgi:hypothetical protein